LLYSYAVTKGQQSWWVDWPAMGWLGGPSSSITLYLNAQLSLILMKIGTNDMRGMGLQRYGARFW